MDVDRHDEERAPERYRFLTLYLPYLVLTAVAFLWPADDALLGVDFRTSWLARSVPSIAGYVGKSPFPSAVAAHLILSGILFLPLFVLALVKPELTYRDRSQMREAVKKFRRQRPFLMLLAIAVGMGGVWISWIQPGYEYGILPITAERWALALAGPLFSFFSLSYVAVFLAAIGVRFSFFVTIEEV
ncbi:hypothetical protein CDL60_20005 [Roseateles noduli]|nr:hypothetical protein CDL60_20005 [Roseateles noduli]